LRFEIYAIVAVPFYKHIILYLQHHRAVSEGWTTDFLCDLGYDEFKEVLAPIVGNCTVAFSCRYIQCPRQPTALKGLASYAVFHFTFNVDQFTLTSKTLYKQYQYAVDSNNVPDHKLIPHKFPLLKCDFVRQRNCGDKIFHKHCVTETERVPVRWSTLHTICRPSLF